MRSSCAADAAERLVGRPAAREVVPRSPDRSGRWHSHDYPSPIARWNTHPELEVHLIRATTGRFVVGSAVGVFAPGQLVLVGPDLPHDWISDDQDGTVKGRDVVFQFRQDWVEGMSALAPEMQALEGLLHRAKLGIEFTGRSAIDGAAALERIGVTDGIERLRNIIDLLSVLACAPPEEFRTLSRGWMSDTDDEFAETVVNNALEYVFTNLTGTIRLSVAADMAGMSPSTFSKFFKRASGQTFSSIVKEYRLTYAAQLLAQTALPISTVAHDAGYSNLSNFNRQFLAEHAMTPRDFRRRAADGEH